MKTLADYLNDPDFRAAEAQKMRAERRRQGLSETLTDPVEIAWLRNVVDAGNPRRRRTSRRENGGPLATTPRTHTTPTSTHYDRSELLSTDAISAGAAS